MRQPVGSGFGLGLISRINRLGHIPKDGDGAAPAPADDEEYFGRRYYGGRYFGARYFG